MRRNSPVIRGPPGRGERMEVVSVAMASDIINHAYEIKLP